MKDYLKRNLYSALLGVAIGVPLSIYAVNHRTPVQYYRVEPVTIETYVTYEAEEINADQGETILNINFQEMDDSDLAEEAYYDSLELLAMCVEAEAGNQGDLGKRLVVDVVLNRVDDPDYPDTIDAVIMQKNQFSVVGDGRIWQMIPAESTYAAVRAELEHRTNYEVLFFTAEGFSKYGTDWQKVGDHYFSTK